MSHITHPVGAQYALKLTPNNALIPGSLTTIDQLYKLPSVSAAKFADWRGAATTDGKLLIADSTGLVLPSYVEHYGAAQGALWFNASVAQSTSYLLYSGSSFSRVNSSAVFTPFVFAYGFAQTNAQFVCRKAQYATERESVAYSSTAVLDGSFAANSTSAAVASKSAKAFDGRKKVHWTGVLKSTTLGAFKLLFYRESNPDISLMVILTSPAPVCLVQVINDGSYAAFILAGKVAANTFFTMDIVYDGDGATDDDKLKLYINSEQIARSAEDSVGPLPSVLNSGEEKVFIGSNLANGMVGSYDECRCKLALPQTNEIAWRYNQWNNAAYWTTTIQPMILTVNDLHNGTIQLTGSGFKPVGGADPTVTVNGGAKSVSSVSDTSIIVTTALQTTNTVVLTNSDGNAEEQAFTAEVRHAKSNSHGMDFTF